MNEILQLLGTFALVFAAAFGLSYAATAAMRRRSIKPPQVNTVVRFKCGDAMYRSVFLGESPEGWLLSAPLQRDHAVPIRVGEVVKAQIAGPRGVLCFRSEVVARTVDPWRLVVKRPEQMQVRERRDSPRRTDVSGLKAGLDGEAALLVDLSQTGARLATRSAPERGERLRVDLPWLSEPMFGYVLEVGRARDGEAMGVEVRLRFEEALPDRRVAVWPSRA